MNEVSLANREEMLLLLLEGMQNTVDQEPTARNRDILEKLNIYLMIIRDLRYGDSERFK